MLISVWYCNVWYDNFSMICRDGWWSKTGFLFLWEREAEEHGFMKAMQKTLNFKCFSQLSALQIWKSESQEIIII